jgi:hypothetical protein
MKIPSGLQYAAAHNPVNIDQANAGERYRQDLIASHATVDTSMRDFANGLIGRLYNAHRAATGFLRRFQPLLDAARTIKEKNMAWEDGERRKAEQEQRRQQARLDAETERKRQSLLKKAEELKTPELRDARKEEAAAIPAPIIHVPAPTVVGMRKSMRWTTMKLDLTAFGIPVPIQGYFDQQFHPDGRFKSLTLSADRLAKAKTNNTTLSLPGVTFEKKAV